MTKPSSPKKNNGELTIIILAGEKEPERAIFGLAYALTAATMEMPVTVFFAMDGARLVSADLEDRVVIDKYQSIPYYLQALQDLGVKMAVCSSCIENVGEPSSNFTVPTSFCKPKTLKENISIMGIASLFHSPLLNTIVF